MIRLVQLRGVCKASGSRQILRGVDLDVECRRVSILVGGSDQGKSLIVRLITRELRADSGVVFIDGDDISSMDDQQWDRVRRKMGVLGQHASYDPALTVVENVAPSLRKDLGHAEELRILDLVKRRLVQLGIPVSDHEKYPAAFSSSILRRVALARETVMNPKLLICDEPTTALDPSAAQKVEEVISRAASKFGTTVLLVTHDLPLALRSGYHIFLLHNGWIVFSETPQGLLASGMSAP